MSDPGPGEDGSPSPDTDSVAAVAADCLEQAPAVLVAFDGPQFRIAAVNAAGRALLGHRAPLLGAPAREALGELAGRQLFEVLERVHATGHPESAREWRVQLDQDGDGRPEDHWLTFTVGPWRRADGTVRGVLTHVTEVTDTVLARREAQTRAREAQQRYRAAHEVAAELQRVLLPKGLPVLPRARVDARYCVAGEEQAAGGDWFDAVALPDGRLALVVGDVVGHGVTAAAVMGQLRAVLRQLLTSTSLPGALPDLLRRLGGFARLLPDADGTTLAVAVLDPATGALHYATCGHPPPLVVDESGRRRLLPITGAGPLGTARNGASRSDGDPPVRTREDALAPGELLVLYSDGLVEREGRPLAEALAELGRVAADAAAGRALSEGAPTAAADRVAGLTVELLTRAGYTDDVTVLVAQRLPEPVPPLHLDEPAEPPAVRRIRHALDDWLAALGVDPGQAHDLQLAVGEAVANGIEHAYPHPASGTVTVHGRLDGDGVLHLDVDDHGRWRDPTPAADGRGRGLAMMRLLLDDVQVHPRPGGGTRVRLAQQVIRPVVLAVDAPPGPTRRRTGAEFAVRVGPERGLTVHATGPVDTTSAGELAAALLNTSRGGTLALTVDLTEVTLLGSAGVLALHTVRDQFAAQGQDLRLHAPPGTPARQVLDLVALAASLPPDGSARA